MSTVAKLVARGELVRIETELGSREQPLRLIYGTAAFLKWLEDVLPGLQTAISAPTSPLEQVDEILHHFEIGKSMDNVRLARPLKPLADGVYELKTADIRMFGWVPSHGVFIAVVGDDATRIKDLGLYPRYIRRVIDERHRLMGPKSAFLTGAVSYVV